MCAEKLKRASAARHAGHFCGNRWCAAVPEAAACVGGCPIELPRYDKNMPNLLPIDLLQPMPYGEAWVYGCARKDGAGEPDSCGGEKARDVHSALEKLRYLDEHAKGKSGAVSCACDQRKRQAKKDDDRHMVIVLTDIGWEMAVAAEWGGLGLPRLTAAREELFDAAPYLVATGEDWALLTSLTPNSVWVGSAQQKALLAVQTALRAPSGSGVRPLIETEASAERRTSIFSRALLGGDGSGVGRKTHLRLSTYQVRLSRLAQQAPGVFTDIQQNRYPYPPRAELAQKGLRDQQKVGARSYDLIGAHI